MDRKAVQKAMVKIGTALHAYNPIGFPVPGDEYSDWVPQAFALLKEKPTMEAIVGFLKTFDAAFDAAPRGPGEVEAQARALADCMQGR